MEALKDDYLYSCDLYNLIELTTDGMQMWEQMIYNPMLTMFPTTTRILL